MALRTIRTDKEPCLYKICRPVEKFDERLGELIDDMFETMEAANGAGLAAPQVGILRRVVVIDAGDGKIELVESVITKRKAVTRMIQLIERDIAGRTPVRLSVFHAGVPEEAAELTQRVEAYFHPIENIQSEVSPVVGGR